MKLNLQACLSLAATFASLLGLEENKSASFELVLEPHVRGTPGTASSSVTAASNLGQPGEKPK